MRIDRGTPGGSKRQAYPSVRPALPGPPAAGPDEVTLTPDGRGSDNVVEDPVPSGESGLSSRAQPTAAAQPAAAFPAEEVVTRLDGLGATLWTGPPGPEFAPLLAVLERSHPQRWQPTRDEQTALGIAFGAALAEGFPVALLRAGALGGAINALSSLCVLFRSSGLLLISLASPGVEPDAEGPDVCGLLLDAIGVRWRMPGPDSLPEDLVWAAGRVRSTGLPAALLLRSELLSREGSR